MSSTSMPSKPSKPSKPSFRPSPRRWLAAVVVPLLACTSVVGLGAAATAPASARSGSVDLRVGSFNLKSVSLDSSAGESAPWRQRRGKIVSQVMGERLAVLGVQEANPSRHWQRRLVSGSNQYLDLLSGLNHAGGHYAVANKHAYNCLNSATTYHCRHRSYHASGGERILYDTTKLRLLGIGALKYSSQTSSSGLYLAWARFRSRANGHAFLFATTHLDPRNRASRAAQWHQLIRTVNRVRNGMPVIVTGDFNTQKFDRMARTMLPAMKRAGYGDVLNQHYRVNPERHVRAQHRVNAWMSTLNHLRRDVRTWSYADRHDKIGNGIDYVFASNRLAVQEYKVVVAYDGGSMRMQGVLPSDHNLVRATITLP